MVGTQTVNQPTISPLPPPRRSEVGGPTIREVRIDGVDFRILTTLEGGPHSTLELASAVGESRWGVARRCRRLRDLAGLVTSELEVDETGLFTLRAPLHPPERVWRLTDTGHIFLGGRQSDEEGRRPIP